MSFERGSTWGKWDLHVHSPASYNWGAGQRLHELDPQRRDAMFTSWVKTINDSDVVAFAIMDYWTFDGVLALRAYARQNAGALKKRVFPGIELRVQSPTSFRLNIHAILSDELSDQQIRDFLSELKVQIIGGSLRNLSPEALREYARSLHDDQLPQGLARDQLAGDEFAWQTGSETAEVTLESFRKAMASLPADSAVVFQPWDTYHGLSELKWRNHYTAAHLLFTQPEIFECKSEAARHAFIGHRTNANGTWFDGFWTALGGRARLAVRGSDAHAFGQYGQFQSALPTWIKAAPTFRGLLQAIKEPAQRSWLGELPPKLERMRSRPSSFIDRVALRKAPGHNLTSEDWFDGQELPLSPDLVAVIGNKGSGKSALADIVALLGDTSNVDSFSFLTTGRFRDRKNNRSLHFEGELTWANDLSCTRRLSEDPPETAVERVRYIPQSFFERVCSGQSEADLMEFTGQIERVIFAHVPAHLRGDADDLTDLLREQEAETNRKVTNLRSELQALNREICALRRRTSKAAREELAAELALREQQLADLQRAEPPTVEAPSQGAEQDPNVVKLASLVADRKQITDDTAAAKKTMTERQGRYQAALRVGAGLRTVGELVAQEVNRMRADAVLAGLAIDELVQLTLDEASAAAAQAALKADVDAMQESISGSGPDSLASRAAALDREIEAVRAELGTQQLAVQAARERHLAWERDLLALTGPSEVPTTIAHVQNQIAAIDAAPDQLLALRATRNEKSRQIATELTSIRASREAVVATAKATIEEVLPKYPGFSLDFVNEVFVEGLEERFFALVKQVSGTFRGEDDGPRAFREIVEAQALETPDDLLALAARIEHELVNENRGAEVVQHDIDALVRTRRTAEDVLDLLYGFEYVVPRFTLAQGGQPLTQLSPGQRGAMLLVFFLLVEDSDVPIVLDQPEENLDNETVYALLVPAIKKAKERRQIIMVTHNANLAVCCDAEQVVHSSFDRAQRSTMRYRSGPIEEASVNELVVNVLEGTRPAFDNRRSKYQGGKRG
jgi:hypothetical protein